MSRLPNQHPIFNRSVFWTLFLFSAALFVPWVLAETLPDRLQPKSSSATPSPQSKPVLQPPSDPLAAEREWHQQIASQSLSWERSPDPATNSTAAKTPDPKTEASKSPSAVSHSNTNTSQSSKTIAKAQTPEASKTSKQQKSKSHSATKSKTKASQSSHTAQSIDIRVAISTKESSLVVGTSTPSEVLDARGKVLGKLSANQATNVVPTGSNIRMGAWETPAW